MSLVCFKLRGAELHRTFFTIGTLSFFGATQGSAIKQSFTAQEGDVLSFDWQFLTEEVTDPLFPFFDKNDSAFLVLLNSTTSQAQVTTLADVFSGTAADSTTISTELQPDQTLNSTVRLQAGEYTLGFAVVDDTDVVATSTLLVDNIRQLNSSDPQSTPEPSLLLSLSILGPCFLRSRYRK